MNVVQGKRIVVSERGWFAPPFTGCRFAEIAKQAVAQGYDAPLARQPNGADNFVRDLQLAGDSTPRNGSTMRQGQAAIRALLPDAEFFFGKISDTEFFDFIQAGATISFAVNCRRLPRYLKNFVGYGYDGGHYMGADAVYGDSTEFDIDLSDAMYRPARDAKPRRVPFSDVSPAIIRANDGQMIVTMSFVNSAYIRQQITQAQAALDAANSVLSAAEADVEQKSQALSALQTQHDGMTPSAI